MRREVVELWIAAFHCGLDCKLKCQERFLHFLRRRPCNHCQQLFRAYFWRLSTVQDVHCSYWKTGYPLWSLLPILGLCISKIQVCSVLDTNHRFFHKKHNEFPMTLNCIHSELYPPTAHYCLYFSSILQFPLSANMRTRDHKRLRGSLGTVEMQ